MGKLARRVLSVVLAVMMVFGMMSMLVVGANAEGDVTAQAVTSRYTVLLLETESDLRFTKNGSTIYTLHTPIAEIKQAAIKFVDGVLKDGSSNYVAIVTFDSLVEKRCDFSNNNSTLTDAVNGISQTRNGSDMNGALEQAETLLDAVSDPNAIKNIVTFTQGIPRTGKYSETGKYSSADCTWYSGVTGIHYYKYANVVYTTSQRLQQKYNVYTIGFFNGLEGMPSAGRSVLSFAKTVAKVIQNSGFYEVDDPNNLEFAFGDVVNDLAGTASATVADTEVHLRPSMFSKPSNAWNNDLAFLAAALTTVAGGTSSASIIQAYSDLGFDANKIKPNGYPKKDAFRFSIASKKMCIQGKDTDVVVIVCAGTEGLWQGLLDKTTDANDKFYKYDNTHDYYAYDYFNNYCKEVRDVLVDFLIEHEISGNPKYLIAGHSLGGAAVDLLAASLANQKNNVYAFTFGALNSIAYSKSISPSKVEKNDNGILSALTSAGDVVQFDNIFNIYNWHDCFGPFGLAFGNPRSSKPLRGDTIFEKFGHVVTFESQKPCSDPAEGCTADNHDMSNYLHAVEDYISETHKYLKKDSFNANKAPYKTVVDIACPVDVALYDQSGKLLGRVVNNIIQLADPSIAIVVVDDEKSIWLPDDSSYQIQLTATDSGTMEYRVETIDLIGGKTGALKEFINVALTPGKQMVSVVGGGIAVPDVRLLVTDTSGTPIKEVLPDGTEQPFAGTALKWWQKLPGWLQWILRYILFGWIWMK